ncbi:IS3 family transposase [Fulvivirga kasyanovii]|uniref:IS3 family transposase n=1 Tax=Fulvivirga kasyanovii TaxID=396812 RepID=UPI001FE5217B|nr:IS3 family transposase [Fulvivirga kasyanovii]
MEELYQVAGVSRQAYHQHRQKETNRQILLLELEEQVKLIRAEHPGCGLEKIYRSLRPAWIGRDRFISTFQSLGYGVVKRKNFQRTTIPTHIRFPNLISGMLVYAADVVWQTDITYFYCNGRFYYLVFIIDIYTKVIKGYAVSDHMRAEANISALKMALKSSGTDLSKLIHHSDRGSQYVDLQYQKLLKDRDIKISMGICAQDNAYAERINGTIKNEYLKLWNITSFRQLQKEVRRAVYHYNNKRIHNHLPNDMKPIQFQRELVSLSDQDRPKVIVYAEGNCKIREASNLSDFRSRKEPQVHDCPIVIC